MRLTTSNASPLAPRRAGRSAAWYVADASRIRAPHRESTLLAERLVQGSRVGDDPVQFSDYLQMLDATASRYEEEWAGRSST